MCAPSRILCRQHHYLSSLLGDVNFQFHILWLPPTVMRGNGVVGTGCEMVHTYLRETFCVVIINIIIRQDGHIKWFTVIWVHKRPSEYPWMLYKYPCGTEWRRILSWEANFPFAAMPQSWSNLTNKFTEKDRLANLNAIDYNTMLAALI